MKKAEFDSAFSLIPLLLSLLDFRLLLGSTIAVVIVVAVAAW